MMPRAERAVSESIRPRYKKRAIPNAARREVARRYGAEVGTTIEAPCHYCGKPGRIIWETSYPYWPMFDHEFDHVVAEFHGGPTTAANLVLACRPCNRSKATGAAPRR